LIAPTDFMDEGNFVDMDDYPLSYDNWKEGEPNNAGDGEDCVSVSNGLWEDVSCTETKDCHICEKGFYFTFPW